MWLLTDANGKFAVSVANDQVESTLVKVECEGCESELLAITFA